LKFKINRKKIIDLLGPLRLGALGARLIRLQVNAPLWTPPIGDVWIQL